MIIGKKRLQCITIIQFSPPYGLQVVKNSEGSEISLYFQAIKTGCQFHGRWQKTQDALIKELHYGQCNKQREYMQK